jgi:hypothetical protein
MNSGGEDPPNVRDHIPQLDKSVITVTLKGHEILN